MLKTTCTPVVSFRNRGSRELKRLNDLYHLGGVAHALDPTHSNEFITEYSGEYLYFIFKNCLSTLCAAELKFEKDIAKLYVNSEIKKSLFVSVKEGYLRDDLNVEFEKLSRVQKCYLDLFSITHMIVDDFRQFLMQTNPTEWLKISSRLLPTDIELLLVNSFLNPFYLKIFEFKILIISDLISLHKKLSELAKLVTFGKSYRSPELSSRIASTGGNVANYGEHILISRFVDLLKNNRPTAQKKKFKNIREVADHLYDKSFNVLKIYKHECIGTVDPVNGKKIGYGQSLELENLLEKFRLWARVNTDFSFEMTEYYLLPGKGHSLKNK